MFTDLELNRETWRATPGYEDTYAVSDLGRVKRTAPGKGTKPGRLLKSPPDSCGYPRVRLSKAGRQEDINVHILVAGAFLGDCPPDKEVNHKDLDRSNNRQNNLEYITHAQNAQHSADSRRAGLAASAVV